MKCLDIAEHARLIAPSLALNFGKPPARAEMEMEVDDSVIMTGEQLNSVERYAFKQHPNINVIFWCQFLTPQQDTNAIF